MGRLFAAALLLLPLFEIALFVVIGRAIGVWATLLGVVLSGLAGVIVLRLQGAAFLATMRDTMARGGLAGRVVADATMVGIAGALLLIPGYFTDLVAILLLVPPVRRMILGWLGRHVTSVTTVTTGYTGSRAPEEPATIDLDESDWRQR